jgi:DNA processing protein
MDKRGLLDLIIARIPGLSQREKIALCENFNSDEEFSCLGTVSGIESLISRRLNNSFDIDDIRVQAELDAITARAKGIKWLAWTHTAYPPLLREIYDPPVIIFYRGNLPDPEKPLAAIVGTRRPSPQALRQACDISRDLGRMGLSVVSGLALGIDAMAHRGNMESGCPTFAVLGSGLDEIYPQTNRMLARRILETGGGLISEYPPGTLPYKWNFPARNRIISGMARGVLIAEAPKRSGALITARYALDQNRDLWVASAGAGISPQFDRDGSMQLAENGAKVITGAADILKDWNMETDMCYCNEKTPGIQDASAQNSCGKELAETLAKSLNLEL